MRWEKLITSIVFAAILALASSASFAAQVTVAWDANPPAENVTGYVVHYGGQSQSDAAFAGYANSVEAGNVLQATVTVPDDGFTQLAVTAHNAVPLYSGYSAELWVYLAGGALVAYGSGSAPGVPSAPGNLRIVTP